MRGLEPLRLSWLLFLLSPACIAVASPRDHAARASFIRSTPCPATGSPKVRHACPGYVVDHIIPLCAGGQDRAENMQWQAAAEAKAKDREERRMCRSRREPR